MSKKKKVLFDKPKKVEENLWQLGSNYFIMRVWKGSGKEKKSFHEYFDGNKTEARKRKKIFLANIEKKDVSNVDKGKITFFEFCEYVFIPYCIEEKMSPTTITGYEDNLNRYMDDLGDLQLRKMKTEKLQQVITKMKNRDSTKLNKDGSPLPISSTTANGEYRVLRNVFNRAVDWDYIEYSPLLKVKCPPMDAKEKESYNQKELYHIFDLLYSHNKKQGAMFILGICSGLRRSELLGLHLPDDLNLNFETKTKNGKKEIIGRIEIQRSAVYDKIQKKMVEVKTKTPKSQRVIFIPTFCAEIIKDYLDNYRKHEVNKLKRAHGNNYLVVNNLFLGAGGGIMHQDTPTEAWLRFREKHKLKDVTLHGLRHSYCSLQRNKNKLLSDNEIQLLLGHSNRRMTDHYSHINEDISSNVVSVFNDYKGPKLKM